MKNTDSDQFLYDGWNFRILIYRRYYLVPITIFCKIASIKCAVLNILFSLTANLFLFYLLIYLYCNHDSSSWNLRIVRNSTPEVLLLILPSILSPPLPYSREACGAKLYQYNLHKSRPLTFYFEISGEMMKKKDIKKLLDIIRVLLCT